MQNLAQLISTIRSQTAKLGTAAADRSFCSVLRRNCSSARELHSAVAADCKSLGGSSLLSRGQLSKLVHDFESLSARLEDALDQAQHKMRTRAGSRHGGSFVGARSAPASAAPLQPPHPAPRAPPQMRATPRSLPGGGWELGWRRRSCSRWRAWTTSWPAKSWRRRC